MSSVPLPPSARTEGVIVPTQRTRAMAQAMLYHTDQADGFEAVIRHLRYVRPEQYPALLAVILQAGRGGRPRIPVTYTDDERREAHRRYVAGERGDWVEHGEREYQRVAKRRQVARQRGAA